MDWEEIKFDSLVEREYYRIKWISSVSTDKYHLHTNDIVQLIAKFPDCDITVKKVADNMFVQFDEEIKISYSYITLEKEKIVYIRKCNCDSRLLFNKGCNCGAFKSGDK